MKNYYILTVDNDLKFVGCFECFSKAWDYVSYESNENFVWLISDERLTILAEKAQFILSNLNRC